LVRQARPEQIQQFQVQLVPLVQIRQFQVHKARPVRIQQFLAQSVQLAPRPFH
jgi:hypothetical protein